MISETKISESYPIHEFEIEGFNISFRLDRNCHGGGIILYVRQDPPCKELTSHNHPKNMESIFIELTLRKTKWSLTGGYNPKKESITRFLSHVSEGLDKYIYNYDNIIILGDLNVDIPDESMIDFCNMYNPKNLIKQPTCYKNHNNPSSIDVILTNRAKSFQNSITGLSDHHKMILAVLKTYVKKREPTVINYRNYKNFNDNLFRHVLIDNLQNMDKTFMTYDDFKASFINALEKHAPVKKKTLRGNNATFMNKTLSN